MRQVTLAGHRRKWSVGISKWFQVQFYYTPEIHFTLSTGALLGRRGDNKNVEIVGPWMHIFFCWPAGSICLRGWRSGRGAIGWGFIIILNSWKMPVYLVVGSLADLRRRGRTPWCRWAFLVVRPSLSLSFSLNITKEHVRVTQRTHRGETILPFFSRRRRTFY